MLESKINKLIYNHHDDVDGWLLETGLLVHFPPHVGHELCKWIDVGDQVSLEGDSRTNRNGDKILFPTYIESQGWSLTFEQKKPHDSKGPQDKLAERPNGSEITNADIMRELLEVKQLLKAWDH